MYRDKSLKGTKDLSVIIDTLIILLRKNPLRFDKDLRIPGTIRVKRKERKILGFYNKDYSLRGTKHWYGKSQIVKDLTSMREVDGTFQPKQDTSGSKCIKTGKIHSVYS